MRTAFGLIFHAWDYSDAPGALLDRALGEVGFDFVILPAVTGPLERFRPAADRAPHTFATEGGWHFPISADVYRNAAAKPRTARWCGKRDMLEKIEKTAARCGVRLIFDVNVRAVSGLFEHEPHLRGRDAWGDDSGRMGICPLNADLRELLHATISDLNRYQPAGWQLCDWMIDTKPGETPSPQFDWHPLLRDLSEICFCSACRQIAATQGANPDAAAEAVRQMTGCLLNDPDRKLMDLPGGNLRDYLAVRRREASCRLELLKKSFPGRNFYLRRPSARGADPRPFAQTPNDLESENFTFIFPYFAKNISCDTAPPAPDTTLRPSGMPHFGYVLPVWLPAFRQADELVKAVTAATQAGAELLEFEGLDEAPRAALDWLRLAIRYARRG